MKTVELSGSFKDGEPDGICYWKYPNSKSQSFQTLFQRGLEFPLSKQLQSVQMDKWFLNFGICFLFIIGIIIGYLWDEKAYISAVALYMIQVSIINFKSLYR